MTDPVAPATPPPADQILDVEVDVVDGVDRPATLFGIPLLFADAAALPVMFEAALLPGDVGAANIGPKLTPAGARVAAEVGEELRSWKLTHAGIPPAAIRVTVRARDPWAPGPVRRDVAEAAANLQNRPPPTTAHRSSRTAAELARRHAGDTRRRVLAAFVTAPAGLTDDELAVEVGIIPNRVATRRKELQDDGLLRATGGHRRTRSDSLAIVHELTDLGREVWRALHQPIR